MDKEQWKVNRGACLDCGAEVTWHTKRKEWCKGCQRLRMLAVSKARHKANYVSKRGPGWVAQSSMPLLERPGYLAKLERARSRREPGMHRPSGTEGDGYEYDVGRFVTHERLDFVRPPERWLDQETGHRKPDAVGRKRAGPFTPPRDCESLRFDL